MNFINTRIFCKLAIYYIEKNYQTRFLNLVYHVSSLLGVPKVLLMTSIAVVLQRIVYYYLSIM